MMADLHNFQIAKNGRALTHKTAHIFPAQLSDFSVSFNGLNFNSHEIHCHKIEFATSLLVEFDNE